MSAPLAIIIEDDPLLNKIFTVAFRDDFETESFSNGNDALQRLSQVAPRIVLLDLHLPGASGGNILNYLRSGQKQHDTIVILCTADARQAETLHDQADFVLLKPVSPIQLRQLALRLK